MAESRIQTTEERLFTKEMYSDAVSGAKHTPFQLTPTLSYLNTLVLAWGELFKRFGPFTTVKYNDFTEEAGVVKDTISGFDAYRTYNLNTSIGTTIYGTFNFKEGKKIESIRHTVRPTITYGIQPSFEEYYDTYIIDANGKTAEYTRFEQALLADLPTVTAIL